VDRTIQAMMVDKQDTDVLSVGSPEEVIIYLASDLLRLEDESYFDYTKTCKSPDINA